MSKPAPEPSASDLDRWISVAMAEYDTLRAESLQAQRQQQDIVRVGLSAIALLATLLNFARTDEDLLTGVLVVVIPCLAISTLIMWLGELERMVRAGNYLARREETINQVLETRSPADSAEERPAVPALGWEADLSENIPRLQGMYVATAGLLALLATSSEIYGLRKLAMAHDGFYSDWGGLIVVTIAALIVALYCYHRYVNIRSLGARPAASSISSRATGPIPARFRTRSRGDGAGQDSDTAPSDGEASSGELGRSSTGRSQRSDHN